MVLARVRSLAVPWRGATLLYRAASSGKSLPDPNECNASILRFRRTSTSRSTPSAWCAAQPGTTWMVSVRPCPGQERQRPLLERYISVARYSCAVSYALLRQSHVAQYVCFVAAPARLRRLGSGKDPTCSNRSGRHHCHLSM